MNKRERAKFEKQMAARSVIRAEHAALRAKILALRPGCPCGDHEAHVMARRKTADDISVQVWSDGAVTCGINTYVIRGAHGLAVRKAVEAAWLVAGEVALYDHAEIRDLAVKARRAVAQRSQEPRRYLLATMTGAKFSAIKGGRVVRHRRSCGCGRCERERQLCGGTVPFRGPRS